MSDRRVWDEYNEVLQSSRKASEKELIAICEKINMFLETMMNINNGDWIISVNHEFLRAIQHYNLPISVLQTIFNKTTKILEFSLHYEDLSKYDNWQLEYEYNIKYVMANIYGRVMRKMYEADIETIEYVLQVLELVGLKESDIDWSYPLKIGMED